MNEEYAYKMSQNNEYKELLNTNEEYENKARTLGLEIIRNILLNM